MDLKVLMSGGTSGKISGDRKAGTSSAYKIRVGVAIYVLRAGQGQAWAVFTVSLRPPSRTTPKSFDEGDKLAFLHQASRCVRLFDWAKVTPDAKFGMNGSTNPSSDFSRVSTSRQPREKLSTRKSFRQRRKLAILSLYSHGNDLATRDDWVFDFDTN